MEDDEQRRQEGFPLLYLSYQLIDAFRFNKKLRLFKVLSNIPVLITIELWRKLLDRCHIKNPLTRMSYQKLH